jgi:hypothetical protein
MTTKLTQDASSRATATATSPGFMPAIWRATGCSSGTASSTVATQTASTGTVSSRRRRSWRPVAGGWGAGAARGPRAGGLIGSAIGLLAAFMVDLNAG